MQNIERSASQARRHLPEDDKAFIKLLERILRTDQDNSDKTSGRQSENETSGLIIPGN